MTVPPDTGDIARLLDIMAALRTPGSGCAWDLEQDFRSIAPYTIEEAYEVADAIERGDLLDLKDELGDLLLQVVFHARMAQEQGAFRFADVVAAIVEKLIRRHPHVFGEARHLAPKAVKALWDEIKQEEKAARREERALAGLPPEPPAGHLGSVPTALPALTRAAKLTAKAAKVGFDWPDSGQVAAKVREELAEVAEAAATGDPDRIEDEIGDLLFSATNLARHHRIDPEAALRRTNAKFERRFRAIEEGLAQRGCRLDEASLAEMEALWVEAKQAEKTAAPREAVAGSTICKRRKAAAKKKPERPALPQAAAAGTKAPAALGTPALLSGGNPQIPKGYGDAPVQAYIAAMPCWKSALGRRLDALITSAVPGVQKAVKWNSPLYGNEGQGWFLGLHCFTNYIKVAFFRGTSLRPVPPGKSKQEEVRSLDIREGDVVDEGQFVEWVRQASELPGERT